MHGSCSPKCSTRVLKLQIPAALFDDTRGGRNWQLRLSTKSKQMRHKNNAINPLISLPRRHVDCITVYVQQTSKHIHLHAGLTKRKTAEGFCGCLKISAWAERTFVQNHYFIVKLLNKTYTIHPWFSRRPSTIRALHKPVNKVDFNSGACLGHL